MSPLQVIIFDFDGTLFDTHHAVCHSLQSTFQTLLPAFTPRQTDINTVMEHGKGLRDMIAALHPNPTALDEQTWISTCRRLYLNESYRMIQPFFGTEDLLSSLAGQGFMIAIVSNKSVAAIEKTLAQFDLRHLVDIIVGDTTPGATKKPDGGSYFNVLLPALKRRGYSGDFTVSDTVVVGDTEADINFASNIGGAQSIWCRYGYGNEASCRECKPDFTVSSVDELKRLLVNY